MKIASKKNIYLLALFVVCLLAAIIIPTYAKFASNYTTDEDIVGLLLDFDIGITNIEEYEELVIPAGGYEQFNVQITNSTGSTAYYGVWYMMEEPTNLTSDIEIGRLEGSTVSTSASIGNGGVVTVPVIIINNSSSEITVNVGVNSSTTGTGDIEYLGGKYLITGDVSIPKPDANTPNLDSGNLIPVYYDDTAEAWKKADSSNVDNSWYDYDNKMWANAVLISDSTKKSTYQSATVGTTITDSDITAFYVWIPRYKYRVWNITRQGGDETTYAYQAYTYGIDIEWEEESSSTGNVECTYNINSVESESNLSDTCVYNKTDTITTESGNTNYTDAWYTHPAFTFGGEAKTGFWIGKFETTGTADSPTVLPDIIALRYQNVSSQFTISKIFQNYLSNNIDAHMLTNLEWGAVAYLSHSIYGLCDGENNCRDVYINNSRGNYTGRSAGVLAPLYSSYSVNGTYDYKGHLIDGTTKDTSKVASTTGNITGVYDMSGGTEEYVMGNMVDDSGAFYPSYAENSWNGSSVLDGRYYNSYSYDDADNMSQMAFNKARLGDATAEVVGSDDGTFGNAWQPGNGITGANSSFIFLDSPWFLRGGNYGNTSAGPFNFGNNVGSASGFSFRSSLS